MWQSQIVTVHAVQSFMKGHRKSGVISIEIIMITIHLQWNNVHLSTCDSHKYN